MPRTFSAIDINVTVYTIQIDYSRKRFSVSTTERFMSQRKAFSIVHVTRGLAVNRSKLETIHRFPGPEKERKTRTPYRYVAYDRKIAVKKSNKTEVDQKNNIYQRSQYLDCIH